MKIYRIYTEDKNRAGIVRIMADCFAEGFSVFPCLGFFAGETESGLVVEVLASEDQRPLILACADQIKTANSQQCVLVSEQEVKTTFV